MAGQLFRQNPKFKLISAGGFGAEIAGQDFLLEEGVNFLTKPFQAHKPTQTSRQRLDSN
jgi:hypothetical protein